MSELETAATVVDTAGKAFDKIDNEEKKEGFLSLIEGAKENSAIQWCKEQWSAMTEEQKKKLYDRGAVTVWKVIKEGNALKGIGTLYNGVKNTAKHGGKNAMKYAFLEQIPARFFVELGFFDKPEGLTDEQLCKDIKNDAKNYNLCLSICEAICTVVPDAQAALPFIKGAKQYTKWYKNEGSEALIAQINKNKENEIKENTSKELAGIIGGGEQKQAA